MSTATSTRRPHTVAVGTGDRTYKTTLWVTLPEEAELVDADGNHKRRQRTFEVTSVGTKKEAREAAKAHATSLGFIKPRTVKGSSKRVMA